jgi:hypothetical protein
MRIVLGRLKELLIDKAPHDLLEYRINRVIERLITTGKYDGLLQPIRLIARWGVIPLPPNFRTIEGAKLNGRVRETTARYFEYLPGRSDYYGDVLQYIEDVGDNYATLYDLPLGGRGYTSPPTATIAGDGAGAILQVQVKNGAVTGCTIDNPGTSPYTTATVTFTPFSGPGPFPNPGSGAKADVVIENGLIAQIKMRVDGNITLSYPGDETLSATLYGTDPDGMPISLKITGNTTVANPFNTIDRIHKEKGDVVFNLTHTSISGFKTPLTLMPPSIQESYYRRYICNDLTTTPVAIVSALAKLRHVELEDDSDVVPFSNISVFELGLKAVDYEAEGDLTLAAQYWQKAVDVLDDELKDMISPDQVPNLRMWYPGRTVPHMSSTM